MRVFSNNYCEPAPFDVQPFDMESSEEWLKELFIRIVVFVILVWLLIKWIVATFLHICSEMLLPSPWLQVLVSHLPRVVIISAVIGTYEKSAKPFPKQTVPTDFIMCTNNPKLINSGNWTIDSTPYHITQSLSLDRGQFIDSFSNNRHIFNIAKY
jgi:hypothetical protein